MSASLMLFDGEPLFNGVSHKAQNMYGDIINPTRDYSEDTEQLVLSTRNANGEVVAHDINRRLIKFNNLRWPYLSREQVTWLKKKIANFRVKVTYFDSEADGIITREFYFGDFSATPCEWDTSR